MQLPAWMLLPPSKFMKTPPASSMMILSGAKSHGAAEGSPDAITLLRGRELAGDERHAIGQLGMGVFDPAHQLESALGAQPHVDEQDVRAMGRDGLLRLGDGEGEVHGMPEVAEPPLDRPPNRGLVVDVQDGRHAGDI